VGKDIISLKTDDIDKAVEEIRLRYQIEARRDGDGLCFFTGKGTLVGCRVNQVRGGKIYPNSMEDLAVGTEIFRNFDSLFSRALKQSSHCRTIGVDMAFHQEGQGVCLRLVDEDGVAVEQHREIAFAEAREPLRARASIESQLARTGGTVYRCESVTIHPREVGFLPLSFLNELRRQALAKLSQARLDQYRRPTAQINGNSAPYPEPLLDYRANVANRLAEKFYGRHRAQIEEWALELQADSVGDHHSDRPVMTTRYCLRYQLDACLKSGADKKTKSFKPPLRIFDRGQSYRLEFDCRACRMLVIPEDEVPPLPTE